MKKLIPLIVVGLLLLVVQATQADSIFDEIGNILRPAIPDEVSAGFMLTLEGNPTLMVKPFASYDLVHLVGKPFYCDIWRIRPDQNAWGAGFSYKLFGTNKRFGVGYDDVGDSALWTVYFRQAVELDL